MSTKKHLLTPRRASGEHPKVLKRRKKATKLMVSEIALRDGQYEFHVRPLTERERRELKARAKRVALATVPQRSRVVFAADRWHSAVQRKIPASLRTRLNKETLELFEAISDYKRVLKEEMSF